MTKDSLDKWKSSGRAYGLGYFCLPVLALLMAGCAAAKRDHYDVPKVPLPAKYKNAPADQHETPGSKGGGAKSQTKLDPVLVEWWHVFGSPELDDLINRGLANNPDVRIATFKIAQAKARADQADAGKGPTITVPVGVSEQYPYYGVEGPVVNGLNLNGPHGENIKQLFQASIQGAWRADLWGELDSLAQSANLQLWSASFERDNVQGKVAANIASSYIEYLALNDRIRVARQTETTLRGMVAAVEGRMEIGDATAIDLEQERSAVYAVQAVIPVLEQQREDALGTIAFLVGTVPESLKLSRNGLDSLTLPSVIPGVPSSLLLRRPDVRTVEAKLLAADADIDVARARILPPLDLTTQVGYGGRFLSDLFKPETLFWTVIGNLSATIFDGGKLSREKDYAKAVHEEMVETYVRTVYQAVREVESSLNAIRQTENRLEAQKASAEAAHRAWEYNSEVFAVGGTDFLPLLDAERTYQKSLDEYLNIRMERYRALIDLFHALGGGVPLGEAIPGKGERPGLPPGSKTGLVLAPANGLLAVDGADWRTSKSYEKEDAWLVELPGLYHRKDIDAAWLDLRTRFPLLMENRFLRRYQKGRMEDSADKRLSWYRLYIAKFPTAAAAEAVCTALKAGRQRCRVVFSQKGDIVDKPPSTMQMDGALASAPREEIGQKPPPSPLPAPPEVPSPREETNALPPQLTLAKTEQLSVPAGQSTSKAMEPPASLSKESTGQPAAAAPPAHKPVEPPDVPAESAYAKAEHAEQTGQALPLKQNDIDVRSLSANAKANEQASPMSQTRAVQAAIAPPSAHIPQAAAKETTGKVQLETAHGETHQPGIAGNAVSPTQGGSTVVLSSQEREPMIGQASSVAPAPTTQSAPTAPPQPGLAAGAPNVRVQAPAKEASHAEELRTGATEGAQEVASLKQNDIDVHSLDDFLGLKLSDILRDKTRQQGVDWFEQRFWLVEVADGYDRNGVVAAWRNLLARFPELMRNRTIIPRRQGSIDVSGKGVVPRYRLYIAKFSDQNNAEEFCSTLRAGRQSCGVISSHAFVMQDALRAPSTLPVSRSGRDDGGAAERGPGS